MAALVREAASACYVETYAGRDDPSDVVPAKVCARHFNAAFSKVFPSVSKKVSGPVIDDRSRSCISFFFFFVIVTYSVGRAVVPPDAHAAAVFEAPIPFSKRSPDGRKIRVTDTHVVENCEYGS